MSPPLLPTAIDHHAAIGDCRSLALVTREGDIDWCCLPEFSSPSVFAALLDEQRGGRCRMRPDGVEHIEQAYARRSNVLVTRFHCATGSLTLHDAMTLPPDDTPTAPQEIVRLARCTTGRVTLAVQLQPRPGYARHLPTLQRHDNGDHWHCELPGAHPLHLHASRPLHCHDPDSLGFTVTLQEGECVALLLRTAIALPAADTEDLCATAARRLQDTTARWQAWCSRCTYDGPQAEAVMRSCLALKLLTHRPSGAVVAAGTTSLPEGDDGQRNWDYRYCWLRDASLVQHALLDMGFVEESEAFLGWLLHATHRTRPCLNVVYDVYGSTELSETTLPWLAGWQGHGPVRVGNAASRQQQHDIYGEVILAAWHHVQRGGTLGKQEQALVVGFVEQACRLWRAPDHGIWEIRLPPRHNTHSKLLCWAGLDRALALHRRIGLGIDTVRVRTERDALRADIEQHGWNPRRQSYVGYYGGDAVDASLLLMVRLGFHPPEHPRLQATVQRILDDLSVDGGLLYRYPPDAGYDGVGGREHLFALCSFWCVGALALLGRLDEAGQLYERLLALRNPVGLYAEEFSRHSGRPMGNFPQAFSHVGSITAAYALAKAAASRAPR